MEGPRNSELLWAKIHLAEGRLFAATHVFWTHPDLSLLLSRFLVQAHILMRSGLILMEVARQRALGSQAAASPAAADAVSGNTVSGQVAAYLAVHLEEEVGHDLWLLDDIRSLGLKDAEIFGAKPCSALVELVGAQYFWMMHVHPVAIFGYLILMEGYAPLVEQLEEIRIRTGAPASAFRCLRAHGEDDPEHLADLNRALDGMELTVEQERAVGMCALAAIEGSAALFEELLEDHAKTAAGSSNGKVRELVYDSA